MSFILLAHWNGRFGNRMHQYAYGVTYSKLNNVPFYLPSDWEGTHLFKTQHHTIIEDDEIRLNINQTHPDLDNINFRTQSIQKSYPDAKQIHPEMSDQNYLNHGIPVFFDSVCAYSNTVFDSMSKKHLLDIFEFSDKVKDLAIYKYWEKRQGTYDVAHLRRDDLANAEINKNPNYPMGYSIVSQQSYFDAFEKFGFNIDNMEWVSDDHTNKWHTDRKPTPHFGWIYPSGAVYKEEQGFDWLDDFLKLYFARTIFRANSSFSWWASFLAPQATVYSPILDKQHIYGRDGFEEINIEFVKGNHPHWMYNNADIIIN